MTRLFTGFAGSDHVYTANPCCAAGQPFARVVSERQSLKLPKIHLSLYIRLDDSRDGNPNPTKFLDPERIRIFHAYFR